MALIDCVECGMKVSENAPACATCGNMMKTPVVRSGTIGWRIFKGISWITFIGSLPIAFFSILNSGFPNGFSALPGLGIMMIIAANIGSTISVISNNIIARWSNE